MHLPANIRQLQPRQDPGSSGNNELRTNVFIICATIIGLLLLSCGLGYFGLRSLRRRNRSPKYIPGEFLKEKWRQWNVGQSHYGQVRGGSSPNNQSQGPANPSVPGSEMNTTGVRRDTSVRSIATLPPYSITPKPTEQVIAREGERGGMDVVVEFPETADEEEARREEHMAGLYQIRQQRRQELLERETRRRERREAQARGDYVRLSELRTQNRRERSNSSNTALPTQAVLAEQRARARDRRISSVSYAELGYVRHDGTRVRSSSPDSDNRPLLQNAAAMTEGGTNRSSIRPVSTHSAGESYSSALSDGDTLTPVASHATSTHSAQTVSTAADDGDVGTRHIPPPDYEYLDWGDAPAYETPIADRGELPHELPQFQSLPTIQIDIASPVGGPPSPAFPQPRQQDGSSSTGVHHSD